MSDVDVEEVIEAFVDGEPVSSAVLKRALADETGRELLLDLLVLRGLVAGRSSARPLSSTAPPLRAPRLRLVVAAATLGAVGVLGGYLAGSHRVASRATRPVTSAIAAPAPVPTHVFRLENGVDWNEQVGG